MPDQVLHVCDFGMSANEQEFWRSTGHYLARPDALERGLHPWRYKACIAQFVDTDAFDAVVWVDADMVVLAPIHEQIEAQVSAMIDSGVSAAAAPDASNASLRGVISAFEAAGNDLSPLDVLIARYQKNDAEAYLNTGFLILTDFEFAAQWARETLAQKDWLLFEQNTFNALVGKVANRVHELDTALWNVHGDLLADIDITEAGRTALLLHTTSPEQRHHIENEIEYPIGDLVLAGWFKLFVRMDLRHLQQKYLLDFLKQHLEHLSQHKLLVKPLLR